MAKAANFSIRMDSDIKAQSEYVYNSLGLNLTTAINVFLRKSIQAGGFPFDVRLDNFNKETIDAIHEADSISEEIRMGRRKPFTSWQEAKNSLLR
ncbi:type II toxin-antitoxin system RelB/DinJ family antitoxin [Treponema sp. HNW]|uniref:type II toxin-antitoxin system RelB/DinJ family antitoxin n=1 Tax=unclassified Treponema TaxID=2638727 RepID=UPI003D133695